LARPWRSQMCPRYALGCTRDLHGTQHLSVQDHAKQFALVPYGGVWEFRYGDSPRDASGAFLFADPRHTDEHWRKTNTIYQPPGRGNQRFLWLRTRLQGPPLSDPALFLQSVNQSFQAFLDGQLIAEFGAMEGPAALRFPGEPRTYLPLLPPPSSQLDSVSAHRYVGRTLVLRVFSPHRYIGVFGELLLGARSTLIADQVQRGASAFVIGLLMIGIGLLALVLFALRFSEHVYFYYGGFALSAGSHFLARSSLHELIVHDPALWGLLVVLTEPLVAVFLAAFVWKTLGRGPWGVMPKLALGYLAMFVICRRADPERNSEPVGLAAADSAVDARRNHRSGDDAAARRLERRHRRANSLHRLCHLRERHSDSISSRRWD
jgi:hypothetical protein